MFLVPRYVEWHQGQACWDLCSAVVNPRNNMKYKVRFLVVKESFTPLLGLNATEKMGLLTMH